MGMSPMHLRTNRIIPITSPTSMPVLFWASAYNCLLDSFPFAAPRHHVFSICRMSDASHPAKPCNLQCCNLLRPLTLAATFFSPTGHIQLCCTHGCEYWELNSSGSESYNAVGLHLACVMYRHFPDRQQRYSPNSFLRRQLAADPAGCTWVSAPPAGTPGARARRLKRSHMDTLSRGPCTWLAAL